MGPLIFMFGFNLYYSSQFLLSRRFTLFIKINSSLRRKYLSKCFNPRDYLWKGEISCGVEANMLDYDIVVSKFELQSRYNVHFRTNTYVENKSHIRGSGGRWIVDIVVGIPWVSYLTSSSYPTHLLSSFLSMEAVRELRTEEKRPGYL